MKAKICFVKVFVFPILEVQYCKRDGVQAEESAYCALCSVQYVQ